MVFYSRERLAIKRLPHRNVALGVGQFTYCISDEEARLNLNTAPPDRVGRLLEQIGLERQARDVVVDSLQDWRDPNEEHRLNGAESEDTYLKLPVPYRSKNGNLDSLSELIQIKGVTAKLLDGEDGRPGLGSLVTVKTPGQINVNTARKEVLRSLNFSDAELNEVEQSRYNFELSNTELLFDLFKNYEKEAIRLMEAQCTLPAYEMVLKSSHTFNLLDARGVISVTERAAYINRCRALARKCCLAFLRTREEEGFPLLAPAR